MYIHYSTSDAISNEKSPISLYIIKKLGFFVSKLLSVVNPHFPDGTPYRLDAIIHNIFTTPINGALV